MSRPVPPAARRLRAALTALLALGTLASCAATTLLPGRGGTRAPEPDSITIALWHLDENGGTQVADAGPFRLDGRTGVDTRTDFGRVKGSRLFVRSVDSFVLVPYSPALESARGLTVEAWIRLNAYGQYEDTPIAARWTPVVHEQSWLFSVVGQRLEPPIAILPSPGHHTDLVQGADVGQLLFAFQPGPASPPLAFTSSRAIDLGRWIHVAVTYDGRIVRFFIDGVPEAVHAATGEIRRSNAPLLVGNFLDPRGLSDFDGELRSSLIADTNPYYAFDGYIDELRISGAARRRMASGR